MKKKPNTKPRAASNKCTKKVTNKEEYNNSARAPLDLSNYPRPLHDINPALIYNSEYIQAPALFYEHGSATFRNLNMPEPYRSLSQVTTISIDNILDSHSLMSYDLINNNQDQESFITQQNFCKEKISRPNAPSQYTSSLLATYHDMPNTPS
ncbi:913_t:CDS:2 [Cetraspora pellucida]|uniref:913_t:CDS:1 n=1 Tax=Cetraspora pellucida TaxID=1433469 RepID=A0A9N9I8L6_9GLOM|nr:913_t:CDS:2 [Cetraspora pellucida]